MYIVIEGEVEVEIPNENRKFPFFKKKGKKILKKLEEGKKKPKKKKSKPFSNKIKALKTKLSGKGKKKRIEPIFEEITQENFIKKKSNISFNLQKYYRLTIPQGEIFGVSEFKDGIKFRQTNSLVTSPTATLLRIKIQQIALHYPDTLKEILNSESEKFKFIDSLQKRFQKRLKTDPGCYNHLSPKARDKERTLHDMKYLQDFVKMKKMSNLSFTHHKSPINYNRNKQSQSFFSQIKKPNFFNKKNSRIFKEKSAKEICTLSVDRKLRGDVSNSAKYRKMALLKSTTRESPSLKLIKIKGTKLGKLNRRTRKLVKDKEATLELILKNEKGQVKKESKKNQDDDDKKSEEEDESSMNSWFGYSKVKKKNKWTVKNNSKDYLSMLEIRSPFHKLDLKKTKFLSRSRGEKEKKMPPTDRTLKQVVKIFSHKPVKVKGDDRAGDVIKSLKSVYTQREKKSNFFEILDGGNFNSAREKKRVLSTLGSAKSQSKLPFLKRVMTSKRSAQNNLIKKNFP